MEVLQETDKDLGVALDYLPGLPLFLDHIPEQQATHDDGEAVCSDKLADRVNYFYRHIFSLLSRLVN